MNRSNDEASPIARLIGPDEKRTVGWVYVWGTWELSVLWIDPSERACFIDPEICVEVWAKAKTKTPEDTISFVASLRSPK